jgi:hypothetical protein
MHVCVCKTTGTCCMSQLSVGRPGWIGMSSIPTRPANSQLKCTTRTNCHIYTLLPPDDWQLASPKHVVEIQLLNKLKINSAPGWFHYTHILRCTVNKT